MAESPAVDYRNVEELIGQLVASRAATLQELRKVSSLEDAFLLLGQYGAEEHMVCQISFLCRSAENRLRHPVFRRIAPDKRPQDCVMPVEAETCEQGVK